MLRHYLMIVLHLITSFSRPQSEAMQKLNTSVIDLSYHLAHYNKCSVIIHSQPYTRTRTRIHINGCSVYIRPSSPYAHENSIAQHRHTDTQLNTHTFLAPFCCLPSIFQAFFSTFFGFSFVSPVTSQLRYFCQVLFFFLLHRICLTRLRFSVHVRTNSARCSIPLLSSIRLSLSLALSLSATKLSVLKYII